MAKRRLLDEETMTEEDRKYLQKMKSINREQEALYLQFKAAFLTLERAKMSESVRCFVLLQVRKNEEEETLAAEPLAAAVVASVNYVNDSVLRGWLLSYSSFCLFLEEHYLKAKARMLKQ